MVQKGRKYYQESGKKKLKDSPLDKICLDQDQVLFKPERMGTRD